jgi:hypothetical protein
MLWKKQPCPPWLQVFQSPEELWQSARNGSSGIPQVGCCCRASSRASLPPRLRPPPPRPRPFPYLTKPHAPNNVQWYTTAVDYWDRQEASVNGVLGGYGHLTSPDVRDSRAFLKKVGRQPMHTCVFVFVCVRVCAYVCLCAFRTRGGFLRWSIV